MWFVEYIREKVLDYLFVMVGYLSSHKMVHVEEDTAELVQDRRGLKIKFVFGGRVREIVLPYNPYRILTSEYAVTCKGEELPFMDLVSTIPGLDDVVFNKENLSKIYGREIESVVRVNDDD